ncbi:cytochrome P450 [Immersiella caudata]|uniref:Cytochrome P450 n=1 Tax=Immersiella caudata TaxID=314043 RepID=A0AA39U4E0_9PEZI|nr:cytochrome P450 [Immersiella caudata]
MSKYSGATRKRFGGDGGCCCKFLGPKHYTSIQSTFCLYRPVFPTILPSFAMISPSPEGSDFALRLSVLWLHSNVDLASLARSTSIILLASLIYLFVYRYFFHPLSGFPGPRLAPFSNALWFWTLLRGRAPWVNHSWHKRYGPVVRIGVNHLSFSTHAAQKIIYGFGTKKVPSFAKDPEFSTPEVDGTVNIIVEIDKQEHARMRRMLSHGFSTTNLLEHERIIHRRTDEMMDRLHALREENGKPGIDIVKWSYHITYDITGEMCFGDTWEIQTAKQPQGKFHWADVITATTNVNDMLRAVCVVPGLSSLVTWLMPKALQDTIVRHAEYATEHTQARLAMETNRKDFVHHMLHAKGCPRPTDAEIASHFQAIMLAGSITTATFLPATIYYLCRAPLKRARLIKEIRERFPTERDITARALMDECPYLNAVCEESLRVYPPAGAAHLTRVVPSGGCDIAGHWVPGGTRVSVHPWSILRDSTNFHAPDQFIPERWLPTEPESQRGDKLETHLPFSSGPRGCLGKNLAYLEMRIIIAKFFWRFDVSWFDENVDWDRDSMGYTVWKKPDFRILVKQRDDISVPTSGR